MGSSFHKTKSDDQRFHNYESTSTHFSIPTAVHVPDVIFMLHIRLSQPLRGEQHQGAEDQISYYFNQIAHPQ